MSDMFGSSGSNLDDANKEKLQEELQQLTALSELQAQVINIHLCYFFYYSNTF